MNAKVRTTMQAMKAAPKHDKIVDKEMKKQDHRSMVVEKGFNRRQSRREKKTALQQDVDKLKKKLRHEENVHRALERAFTRPLGALPRLPPYLPLHTLELLAEVAVLEEEVVRLEEQVVNFRQGLYQEAIYFSSSSKKTKESRSDTSSVHNLSQNNKTCEQLKPHANSPNSEASVLPKPSSSTQSWWEPEQNGCSSNLSTNGKQVEKKLTSSFTFADDWRGKENQLNANIKWDYKQTMVKKISKTKVAALEVNRADVQTESWVINKERSKISASTDSRIDKSIAPNKLSEEILKCLMKIYSRLRSSKTTEEEVGKFPSVSSSCQSSKETDAGDPYGIFVEFKKRDIGPYRKFQSVEVIMPNQDPASRSSFLTQRLKILLRKLAVVDLSRLTHQQKLAFWINIYNACMMNAFLEQGIPSSPEMLVTLMPKAMVNVGGHLLSAMTIEHFILRLPSNSKHVSLRGPKKDNLTMRGIYGLEWPEPLVTFALSCGSWSSPAVRIYTAPGIENELEAAKRDYLQAAVGISTPNKLAIPKLLDWYLLDFAKDVESLVDWICLQLPSDQLRTQAVKCLEMSRRSLMPKPVRILPYQFRFRYLLAQ